MASAASLRGLYISPEEVMVFGGDDLKDYFYRVAVNGEHVCTKCSAVILRWKRPVCAWQWCFRPSDRVAIGLSLLAIGDTCAVEYVRRSHISLMLRTGVAAVSEMFSLHDAIPEACFTLGSSWTIWRFWEGSC